MEAIKMKLDEYLKRKRVRPMPWAIKNKISIAVMSRLMNGGYISIQNALKIEKATHGRVKVQDLFDQAA
jgi:hypothetical protein